MFGGSSANLVIKILSDAKDGLSGLDKTESKIGRVGKVAGGALVAGFAAAGTAAGVLGVAAGKAGSDLEQSIGAIDAIFKGNADQMHTWAKGAAQDVGLTRDEFNGLGTLIGAQLKNGGTAMDELAPKTNELIGLGADLSSMFGGDTKTAVEALSSALKGERDPIEKYGVSLNQASIDAKAAELGFDKVGGALSAEANQAATLALIMDQTTDAHGNFAKESNTVAGQQQRLMASVKNLVAELGLKMLPILQTVFGFLNNTAVPALGSFLDAILNVGSGGELADKLGLSGLKPIVDQVVGAVQSLIPVVINTFQNVIIPAGQQVAENLFPILEAIFTTLVPAVVNAFQTIIPKVLAVVGVLSQLVAAITGVLQPVILALIPVVEQAWGYITDVISTALSVVQSIISTVTAIITGDWSAAWEGIKSILSGAWDLIGTIVSGGADLISSLLSSLWGLVQEQASAAWTGFKDLASDGIDQVISWVSDLPGNIKGALGDMGSLLINTGKDVIRGLLNGIKSMGSALWDGVKRLVADNIPGPIRKVLGISSPSKVTASLGRWTGQGLVEGLESQARAVERATRDLLGRPEKLTRRMGPLDVNLNANTSSSSRLARQARPIHLEVNFNGPVDKISMARQIRQLLDDYGEVVVA